MNDEKKKALGEILVFLIIDTIILVFANQFYNYMYENELDFGILPLIVITTLQIVAIFVILIIFKDKKYNLGFEKNKPLLQFLIGALLFIGMLLIFKLFGNSCAGQPFEINSILFLIILDAISAAITEELAYRGLLFTRFRTLFDNTIVAIIFSSVLFGACHFMVGDVYHIILSAVTGLLLCSARAYIKNCTLFSTMFAHFLYDFLMCYLAI